MYICVCCVLLNKSLIILLRIVTCLGKKYLKFAVFAALFESTNWMTNSVNV
jgi:hypothetical protein